jgi:hypothetical protein
VGCVVYDESMTAARKRDAGEPSVAGSGGSSTATTGAGGAAGNVVGSGGSDPTGGGGAPAGGGQGGVSSGGNAGMAGASGSLVGGAAGSDAGTVEAAPTGTELLIDGMEHAGDTVSGAGFGGHWYLFNDQTAGGVETPVPFGMTPLDTPNAALPTSTQAAHAVGTGFTSWGCGMGMSISSTSTGGKIDARAYTGVTFWARVGAGAATHITVSTWDVRAEMGCVKCNDQPVTSFDTTTSWQKIRLPFSQFRQLGFGDPQFGVYDPKGFGGLQFYVGGNTKLDIWIDDVAFYAQ